MRHDSRIDFFLLLKQMFLVTRLPGCHRHLDSAVGNGFNKGQTNMLEFDNKDKEPNSFCQTPLQLANPTQLQLV